MGRLGEVSLRNTVDWFLSHNVSYSDSHWLPQAYFCELQERVRAFNVILLLSPNTRQDLACLVNKANLSRWGQPRESNAKPKSKWMGSTEDAILKRFFTPT